MGLERQTQQKMNILTDTEMQQLTGGGDPIDPMPLPPIGQTGSSESQLRWLLNFLTQQQEAAYLRLLRTQAN